MIPSSFFFFAPVFVLIPFPVSPAAGFFQDRGPFAGDTLEGCRLFFLFFFGGEAR